jgi:hypothetical protein
MKKRLAVMALAAFVPMSGPASAVEEPSPVAQWEADHTIVLDARDVAISDFHWLARPVVVFADSAADPRYRQQMDLLAARIDDLAERDVVVIVDTDPDGQSDWRRKLRPRGFMLVLIGKDGGVKLRKPFPWDVREISRSIDKMPMRQQEIRDRRSPLQ